MSMSKKDYETVAKVVRSHVDILSANAEDRAYVRAVCRVAIDLATEFGKTNPRFNSDTFLRAAGVRK